MADQSAATPRVNSARLPDYIGRTVRLACKVIKLPGNTAIVAASDDGEITITGIDRPEQERPTDTYVQIIGSVVDSTTIKMLSCMNLGPELDMKLVNDIVELTHDPRFYQRMFA